MLELRNVSRYYSHEFPVHHYSALFESGRIYAIFGPSGSGKTTLLRMIAGLESLDGGQIIYKEEMVGDLSYQKHPFKRGIGMVFQMPALWNHMTVGQNVVFGLNKDGGRCEEVMEALQVLHLKDAYPTKLSGGEKKRVALARMLVHDWSCLLLDEPLAFIDDERKFKILQFIKNYVERNGTTLIYVTHDEMEIEALSAEVIHVTQQGFKVV